MATQDLAVDLIRSPTELAATRERAAERRGLERLLCETLAKSESESWTIPGFCKVCARAVEFRGDWKFSKRPFINFRESLACPICKMSNRKRFMAHLLTAATARASGQAPTYMYEQVTPFFAWAKRALPNTLIGSEYLGPDVAGGAEVDGIRNEDALSLSFSDSSIGMVVSCDVFEHVPDIDGCLAECNRVLCPGGRLYFSVPFHDQAETVQRAALRDGEIVEYLPPQYHRNPIDQKGSLVFYDHGWDILERCRSAGFADAYVLGYWSLLYGYLGFGLQLMLVAESAG